MSGVHTRVGLAAWGDEVVVTVETSYDLAMSKAHWEDGPEDVARAAARIVGEKIASSVITAVEDKMRSGTLEG